jgi:predicted nucleotidyltransferase component of viral defense system
MIQLEQIKGFYPVQVRENSIFDKYMLKEYVQLMILDFLSATRYVQKLSFIGGTNLRLVGGIDRFSEDLDFDCKQFSKSEFDEMTNEVVRFLKRSGFRAETRNSAGTKLKAYRCNIYFPELLFDLRLSGHKEERFLIKIESENQGVDYESTLVDIKGCGFFFPFPVPGNEILCSMKIAALLTRAKGRDFYDLMFLLAKAEPDYYFLSKRCGISAPKELKEAVLKLLETIDLSKKQKDFEHLLFNKENSRRIARFGEFMRSLNL